MLKRMNHPNVAKVYEVIEDGKDELFYFVTEFVSVEAARIQQLYSKNTRSVLQEIKEDTVEASSERPNVKATQRRNSKETNKRSPVRN